MKIKNIMFTGFMAAILGATGAHAAISVASQAYVDQEVKDNVTEVSFADDNTTYLKEATGLKGAAVALDRQVNLNAQAIGLLGGDSGSVQGLVDKVDANAVAVQRLDGDADTKDSVLNKITTAIGGLTGEVTGDTGVVKTISQTDGKITATRAEIVNEDIAADAKIAQSKIDGLTTALAAKADASTVEALGEKVGETSVADQITDKVGAIDGTVADALATKLTAKSITGDGVTYDEKTSVYTITDENTTYSGTGNVEINANNQISVKTAAVAQGATTLVSGNDVYTYAIPKPSEGCMSDTGACVLSSDTQGNLTWVMITEPTGIAE